MKIKKRVSIIGSWISGLLFVYEANEIAIYFKRYQNDSRVQRLWVASLLFVDFTCVVMLYVWVYMDIQDHFEGTSDSTSLVLQILRVVTSILMSVTMILVQMFLIRLCWSLCRRWYIIVVPIFLSLLGTGAAVVGAVEIVTNWNSETPSNIALVASGVADVLIAATLFITLKPMVRNSMKKSTKEKVKKLMVQLVSTGSLTTAFHFTIVVMHVTNTNGHVPHGIALFLGRIYAISMMLNLNGRRWETHDHDTTVVSSSELRYLTTINTNLTTEGTAASSGQTNVPSLDDRVCHIHNMHTAGSRATC
ncbi:hypothetical protein K435DRAFT_226165 [Dendrothele bispora CBS 962.96]|uniref:DUF6534 domain-containing protein n=1 Tax=Dendrothele bispora (strain CBS 962.96) TaxID=1314807 RepID=A0A4S8LQL9_DENBC|nr:hypothetical protein K435DRAFT_226165 [Dendrothele bispora CBS 962.96]